MSGGYGRVRAIATAAVRRIAGMAVTLLVTSFLVFSSLYLAPGDPVSFLIKGRSPNPQELVTLRHRYGFDKPFPVRYWNWLDGVLHGNFGESYLFHQSVASVIWSRLPSTLLLVAVSTLMIAVVGIGAGVVGALRHGSRTDSAVLLLVTVGAAVPSFVAAILLRSVLGVRLGWFPTIGNGTGVVDRLHHIVLPAVALSVTFMALVTRVTRSAMLDELRREHVEVALSRGLPRRTVIRRHVFRNALGPVVTVSGLLVSGMLVSTAIVETAFGMSGIGSLLVQSVDELDFQVVQAIVLLVVAAFVVVNTLVDLLYPLIDPRVASAGERAMTDTHPVAVRTGPRAPRALRALRLLGGTPLVRVSAVVLVLFVIAAALGPLLAPQDPTFGDLDNTLVGPSAAHWLGTDQGGHDTFSALIEGTRTSLVGPLAVVLSSTVAGIAVGLFSAWCGGWVDAAVSRVLDILFAFPSLLLAILAVALFGKGITAPVLAMAVAYMPYTARLVRGLTVQEKTRPYIAAYRVQGHSPVFTAVRRLLPNIGPTVLAQSTVNFGYALLDLAALSFLGLGVQPPTSDWGAMINQAQAAILQGQPLSAVVPATAVVVVVVAFNVVGEHLGDRLAGRES